MIVRMDVLVQDFPAVLECVVFFVVVLAPVSRRAVCLISRETRFWLIKATSERIKDGKFPVNMVIGKVKSRWHPQLDDDPV